VVVLNTVLSAALLARDTATLHVQKDFGSARAQYVRYMCTNRGRTRGVRGLFPSFQERPSVFRLCISCYFAGKRSAHAVSTNKQAT
jgi:hypothetical protein